MEVIFDMPDSWSPEKKSEFQKKLADKVSKALKPLDKKKKKKKISKP